MRIPAFVLGSVALFSVPLFAEDLTISYRVTSGDKTSGSTTWVGSTHFKMAEAEGETIFDLKTGRLSVVDNKRKQYWETTAQEMQAAMAKMTAQFESMPAAIRDKLMGGIADSVKVAKAGAPKSVAGYACQPYVFSVGADPESAPIKIESCNTKDLSWPAQVWDARSAMLPGGASNPMGQRFQKLFDEMKKAEGLAVSETTTMKMMGRAMVTTREVTEIKKDAIPASVFTVPAGYKKVDSPYAKLAK